MRRKDREITDINEVYQFDEKMLEHMYLFSRLRGVAKIGGMEGLLAPK